MKKQRKKPILDTRAKYCIAGAAALLAVLVVVLCAMNGAFDFDKAEPETTPPPATDPPVVTEAPAATPAATPAPTPSPTPAPESYTVTVTAGKGGSVSSNGQVSVPAGEDLELVFVPEPGYAVASVQVDGQDIGPVELYRFSAVEADHSLYVTFRAEEQPEESPAVSEPPETSAPPASPSDITA